MPEIDNLDYLAKIFNDAPCNAHLQPRYFARESEGEALLTIRPDMLHAGGVVHGSTLFKLLDDVCTIAAMSAWKQTTLTSTFTIYFLRPAVTGQLRAIGRVVKVGRRQVLSDGEVYDQDGRLLAKGSGTFMKV